MTQDITLSRVSAQEHPAVVGQLAALLGISSAQIEADLANVQYSLYKPVPILENAPLSDVLYIGEHASMFPGVSTVADTNRTFPLGQTGVQMLGYVGQISSEQLQAHSSQGYQLGDLYGQSGLENEYQADLRGRPGVDKVEVDAHGQVVGSLGRDPAHGGRRSRHQHRLRPRADACSRRSTPRSPSLKGKSTEGAAVALDPQTGAVLALVSSPTYDPTWWTNGISTAHFRQIQATGAQNNNAIQGLYTPGSTFKLATATAALQTGLISPGYTFNDTGAYTVPGCATGGSGCVTYHDNEGEVGGRVNVSQALTVSSDIFFYNLGVQFWNDYKANALRQDADPGRRRPTRLRGRHRDRPPQRDPPGPGGLAHGGGARARPGPQGLPQRPWFTGNNLELAFGQGGTVITPLEQAVAYATFANGGTRYVPEVAAGMVDAHGKVVRTIAPKVAGHVTYSPANYQALLSGFEGVVQNSKGTAAPAFAGFPLSTFPLAGKTGTATTNEQQPNSWFVGWGPVPNPQYLIAVVVQGGGFGSSGGRPRGAPGLRLPRGASRVPGPHRSGHDPRPRPRPPDHHHHHPGATTPTTSTSPTTTAAQHHHGQGARRPRRRGPSGRALDSTGT